MNKGKKVICAFLSFCFLVSGSKSIAQDKLVDRISGDSRYDTSIEALNYWDHVDTAIIASGKNYIDALCASSISSFLDAPIILVNERIKDSSLNKIINKGTKKVIIVGGKNSVGEGLESDLRKSFDVKRISGENRYKTSEEIADFCIKNFDVKSMVISSGEKIEDSLIASSLVAKRQGVLLFSKKDGENKAVLDFSKSLKSYIIGGVDSVSDSIEKSTSSKRLYGKDRYETAREVYKEYGSSASVLIANSKKVPDALIAAAISGKIKAPVIFSDDKGISALDLSNKSKIILVGGEDSISKEKADNIEIEIRNDIVKSKNSIHKEIYIPVNHDNDVVNIPDKNLRKVLNFYIDKNRPSDSRITKGEMKSLKKVDVDIKSIDELSGEEKSSPIVPIVSKKIESLKLSNKRETRGIKSIEGMQYAINLEYLDLSENEISDITPLSKLTNLKTLELDRNLIRDLSPLLELTNMVHLNLYSNYIGDISPIKNMKNLDFLDVHANKNDDLSGGIEDVSVVRNMPLLEKLDISNNSVKDSSPIIGLNNLKYLILGGNNIEDISPFIDFAIDAAMGIFTGDKGVTLSQVFDDKSIIIREQDSSSLNIPLKGYIEFCSKYIETYYEKNISPNAFSITQSGDMGSKLDVKVNPEDDTIEFTNKGLEPGVYREDITISFDDIYNVTLKNIEIVVE